MAHKTFISYKYSEASNVRDRIIESLGESAFYYKGETSESPDLTDSNTENIRRALRDMIYDTSVTIVVLSPNMKRSKWIDWEIEYSLKNVSRDGRTSHTNGVIGVIMKYNGNFEWFKSNRIKADGCVSTSYNDELVYSIINNNRFNQNPKVYTCEVCKTIDSLHGSYISYVEEDTFLNNPKKYIENAYDKSIENGKGYILAKER
jgi:hypothetical protein